MKKITRFTVIAFLAAGMLIVGGCPKVEEDEPIDPALEGYWSNELTGDDERTFTIKHDGSFSATLNPGGTMGWGTVTGKLSKDGNNYLMSGMDEITGATSWGSTVSLYNDPVQIEFSDNNDTFTLTSGNSAIQTFFGGTYHRQ